MEFFENFPEGRSPRQDQIKWAEVKKLLIENEGLWGLIAENVSASTPGQLRAGRYKNFPIEEVSSFQFRVRRPEEGAEGYDKRRTNLYGRYIGANPDA